MIKDKLQKKSQITIFVVLGIVILVVLFGAFALKSQIISPSSKDKSTNIKTFTETCISDTANIGIFIIGRQGGYIYPPYSSLEKDFGNIGIANDKNLNIIPSSNYIKTELEAFINRNLNQCLNNYSIFKDKGYELNILSAPKSIISITPTKVLINLEYQMESKKKGSIEKFEVFSSSVNTRIPAILEYSNTITDSYLATNGLINLTYLGSIDIETEILNYYNEENPSDYSKPDNMIIVLEDKKSKILLKPYKFIFALEKVN